MDSSIWVWLILGAFLALAILQAIAEHRAYAVAKAAYRDALAALVDDPADTALRHYGRIDVWVNGVGVGAVGRFDQTPLAAHRRVVEANLLGHLHGAHVALRHFRERGRGTLINMISAGGWVPSPYAAAYTASKFGLRGLSEALRAEVSHLPHVHVCDVAPTFVDSPGLSHGANYTGRNLQPRIPLLDPERVADAVAALADRPRAVTWLGAAAAPGRLVHAVAPQHLGAVMRWVTERALRSARPVPESDGNLFVPSRGTSIDGGQRRDGEENETREDDRQPFLHGVFLSGAAIRWGSDGKARPMAAGSGC